VVLMVLMVITMTLSDFLNNVATALIAAPIGVGVANSFDVNPGPVPDRRRGGRLLRLPHPDRPQEQHHHHGPRRLPPSATTGAWD
jgi:hypothetical protein